MYKLAEKLIANRYYVLSQDSLVPAMKLVTIGERYCTFDLMGCVREFPIVNLKNRIETGNLWIYRDKYCELIVKYSILMGCEVSEDFNDNEIPQYLKELANASIDLISNWYSEPSIVQPIDNCNNRLPF